MQLFTMGLFLLNPDGTPQLDSNGNMIPTYTQAQVQAFARAYTGWTYATSTGGSPTRFPNPTANYTMPMAAVESASTTRPRRSCSTAPRSPPARPPSRTSPARSPTSSLTPTSAPSSADSSSSIL